MNYRKERDSLGEVEIKASSLWGAQTQRSLNNFKIGTELMPFEVIRAIALIKKAAALANCELGCIEKPKADAIAFAAQKIINGEYKDQFPLVVWQTGSGTQTNMNVNEVIAHLCEQQGVKVHPNDDVNMSQSSNDVFPSAMHIAALSSIYDLLFPALDILRETFRRKSEEYADIIKTARTHMQDAVPITLGQEIGAWESMLEKDRRIIESASDYLRQLALGGTAVGTGLNAPSGFGSSAVRYIAEITKLPFRQSRNLFSAISAKSDIVFAHSAIKTLAADLFKIANDIRLLSSGPRCGIGEITIPQNEPGSSIMPGKVNPTQCEALTMAAVQVMANDTAVTISASQGALQLNTYMPLIIHNFLQSVRLLSDAMDSFDKHCARGIQPNLETIKEYLDKSLMLVTALSPHIGYDNAAKVAQYAHKNNITLKQAALELGFVAEEQYDIIVDPAKMVNKKE